MFLLGANWFGNLSLSLSIFRLRHAHGSDNTLTLFVLFVLLPLGLWQNYLRCREEKLGLKHVHTWWPGNPRLAFLPLSDRLLRLALNPSLCLIAGAFLRYEAGARLLGLSLLFSAFTLLFVEWTIWGQSIEHGRDLLDSLDQAERDALMLQPRFTQEESMSAAISTGSDAGLSAQIQRRRQEVRNIAEKQGGITQ